MEYSTQETQIASQTYTSQREDEPNDANCWGLLWPIGNGTKPVRFNKDKQEYTIGRGPQCDLRISSQIISNVHCRINWDGAISKAGLTIIDLSRNGTWVKGRKIPRGIATLLHDGDEITFGVQNVNSNGESHKYTFRTPVVIQERKGIHVKYELQQELGRGSFAAVHKALQRATGKFFAVKIIPKPQTLLQPSTVNMLDREITILKQLKHPNIVALEDVIGSEVELCIVMELIQGGDLFEYIITSPMRHLTEQQTGQLTAEICDAMAYIHYQGITHRDLKPENILLTSDNPPHVKVADFGLAKCVNSKTMLRTMCGTPSYLAPEVVLQAPGNEGYDHRVDSWSVGAIVFAMLTGQGAFTEDENEPLTMRVQRRKVTWEYMREVGCTQSAERFVDRLLQNDPENRMTLADALGHEWLHPTYWPSGIPSYFPTGSPLINTAAGEPVGTPTNGVTEEFQNLEIDSDSISESPAFIEVDFDDVSLGGASGLTRSQEIQRSVEEREQSWDLVEEPGADPEQTPLARPRLQLLEEEATARERPTTNTGIPLPPLFPQKSLKRKLSGGDGGDDEAAAVMGSSGTESTRSKLGARKASKASEFDTPTATRSRFPISSTTTGKKGTARNGKGKGPVARDFATEGDE